MEARTGFGETPLHLGRCGGRSEHLCDHEGVTAATARSWGQGLDSSASKRDVSSNYDEGAAGVMALRKDLNASHSLGSIARKGSCFWCSCAIRDSQCLLVATYGLCGSEHTVIHGAMDFRRVRGDNRYGPLQFAVHVTGPVARTAARAGREVLATPAAHDPRARWKTGGQARRTSASSSVLAVQCTSSSIRHFVYSVKQRFSLDFTSKALWV